MSRYDGSRAARDLATRLRQLHDAMRRDPYDVEAHAHWVNALAKDAEMLAQGYGGDAPDCR